MDPFPDEVGVQFVQDLGDGNVTFISEGFVKIGQDILKRAKLVVEGSEGILCSCSKEHNKPPLAHVSFVADTRTVRFLPATCYAFNGLPGGQDNDDRVHKARQPSHTDSHIMCDPNMPISLLLCTGGMREGAQIDAGCAAGKN
jgi:hypothetical protein